MSLWATGDAPMQAYFSAILEEEKLMAEPVFQTSFPWEPSQLEFAQTDQIFNDAFIKSLDAVKNEEFRFPKERHPYKHQVESWDILLNSKKSIAVTTGTGSGKTECFMLPVLYDLYTNCKNSTGINAIFLYPLNALIGSQKKRIDAWCRALGGINYGVYNGNTKDEQSAADMKKGLPELISRKQIREKPPQILFTNPSMLEYVLVRNKDVNLLKNSQGTLRWVLLDEAHTLTGSSAAEMALLIRRIVDAFGVNVEQLRFAITSATVGAGAESEARLKTFMANLCGISDDHIQVITGKRVLAQELAPADLSVQKAGDILESPSPEYFQEVQKLREDILANPALKLSSIGRRFGVTGVTDQLHLMDILSERRVDGKSILPVRGHFFTRGIGGVYVCTNEACTKHFGIKPKEALGTMTTIAGILCDCGSPLLELVACRSCGNQLLEGEKVLARSNGEETIQMTSAVTQDAFDIDKTDEDDNEEDHEAVTKFYFTKKFAHLKYTPDLEQFAISTDGKIINGHEVFVSVDSGSGCPHCGAPTANPIHFRLSASFINRVLADIFLEETPEAEVKTQEMLWQGHKYISFTDSRQGTAKISALINQDNEGSWVRSQLYHKLSEMEQDWRNLSPESSREELEEMIVQLESELTTTKLPILKAKKQQEIDEFRRQLVQPSSTSKSIPLNWVKFKDYLLSKTEFRKLFEGTNPHDANAHGRSRYLDAILYDQFARRLPRERSLENLGMVSLVYPKLQQSILPQSAKDFCITKEEWNSLLKIAIDYNIRYAFHFFVVPEMLPYATTDIHSQSIYNPDSSEIDVKRWPIFKKHNIRQNRMALLVCAGLGYHDKEDFDADLEDRINGLLEDLWKGVKSLLSYDGNGFKLRLEDESQFQLSKELWLCPVKKRLLDAHFRGYSPWIKGNLTTDNIRHYKIEKSINFPQFPYAFNIDENQNPRIDRTRDWIEEQARPLREVGIWNNLHEQVILNRPLYLSGEHSAQQNEARLKQLEGKFEKSEINILNCSTTMEMGVDIGGISTVVMNNVPPGPANYMQRAGRAGRRAEAKSVAFTICSPNPIGLNAMADPMWALNHKIAGPFLAFRSDYVVERHINAFFLGKFVQTDAVQGLNVTEKVESFFFKGDGSIASMFSGWLLSTDVRRFEKSITRLVANTPFNDSNFNFLLNKAISNFQSICEKAHNHSKGFEEKLSAFALEFGIDSPAHKALQFQRSQFLDKNAINYLAQESFLPSAGLPTGIVELDTLNIDDIKNNKSPDSKFGKSKPSYFITKALTEFAPGNQIVIDGKSYLSEGIILKNDRGDQAEREIIQSCKKCGYQRIIEVSRNEDIDSKCAHCGEHSFRGIAFKDPELRNKKFTEMIQPAGFAVDIYSEPSRKISGISSVQYVDPLLLNVRPWQNSSTAIFDTRETDGNGEILFYNVGSGNGYSVCLHCGRTSTDPKNLINHKRLRGGKNKDNERNAICSGNDGAYSQHENVILGGRFKTDFCELRIKDHLGSYSRDEALLYTLGAILSVELTHYLSIEANEVSFGVKKYDHYLSLFFFDTAKGGAGYASQFGLYTNEIFTIAKDRLSQCTCEKACTKCLIDRNTQWHRDKLDRKLALAWLETAINLQVPITLQQTYPKLKALIGGIKDEINRMSYANRIKEIWFYGASDIQSWDLERLQFLNKLRDKCRINFVLNANIGTIHNQAKISLIQLSAWSDVWKIGPISNESKLRMVCKILTDDGSIIEYMAVDFEQTFNENWGNSCDGVIYKNVGGNLDQLKKIDFQIDQQNNFIVEIDEAGIVNSDDIASLLLRQLEGKLDLNGIMHGQSFDLSYSDRYLKNPFGVILMVQFIDQLKTKLNFNINSFSFKGQEFQDERVPYLLFHTFRHSEDRNNAVNEFASQLGIQNVQASDDKLPHYRYFEFKNDNVKIIIRPDGGIEHGWFLNSSSPKLFNERTDANNILKINRQGNGKLLYTLSIEQNES